jgi:hypothetical protein
MKHSFIPALFAVVLMAIAPSGLLAKDKAGQWTVTLTKKQNAALAEMNTNHSARAFAISPDGAWGRSWDNTTKKDISDRALSYCRAELRKGKRDCIVYSVNGKVVAPVVVTTKTVSQVYKPVNGNTAPKFFGRVPFNFTGDKSAAQADFAILKNSPAHRNALKRDKKLEAALTNASFMNKSSKGFAIWFEKGKGSQFSGSNNGILRLYFNRWLATPDGLVCMFDAEWSTGKRVGTRCLVLENVSNGIAKFFWAGSSANRFTGQIVAGDARRGAAR